MTAWPARYAAGHFAPASVCRQSGAIRARPTSNTV